MPRLIATILSVALFSAASAQVFFSETDRPLSFPEMQRRFMQWQDSNDLETAKGWKYYKRWENFFDQRANANGSLPDPAVFRQEAQKVILQKQAAYKTTPGSWVPAGPVNLPPSPDPESGHGMGRINCVTFHPTDPNTLWVGVAQGGVWKSTNGGASWMPLTDDLPVMRVSDIAVDPTDPDILYICVGDYAYLAFGLKLNDRKRHTHFGLGVYKSVDGGQTWAPTGLGFSQTAEDLSLTRRVLINPANTQELVAAGIQGIWRSVNGGANWTEVLDSVIWDIEQDAANPPVIYASSGYVNNLKIGAAGIMKSTDFGATWTMLNTGIPPTGAVQRVELAISPKDPNYVYAIACDLSGGFYGLYRSTNGGASWSLRSDFTGNKNILAWYDGAGENGGQGTYDLVILADPSDRNRIYAGGVNLWGSDDGGVTWDGASYWQYTYGPSIHADQHQLRYNARDDKFYICNDGGIARTDTIITGSWNDAQNVPGYNWPTVWENISDGLHVTSFYRLGLSSGNNGNVIAGAQDNSTFYKNNGNWINIIGGDGMEAMLHPADTAVIYGSSQYGRIVRSDNGGYSSTTISNYMRYTAGEQGEWTTPFLMHPADPNTIYAAFGNVWKSTNKGANWTVLSNFPDMGSAGYPVQASNMDICLTDPDYIYVTKRVYHSYGQPSEVRMTANGGGSWSNVSAGLPDSLYPTDVAVHGKAPLTAWVTYSSFYNGIKVFRTDNGGQTWTNISYDLPNLPVNTIVHDTASANNCVFAGTDVGVYYTYDGLNAWLPLNNNLPNVIVSELEIHYPTYSLYAATFGRAIWSFDLTTITGTGEEMLSGREVTVYPNPNNGSFTLSAGGLQAGKLRVEIIDITGRRVHEEVLRTNGTVHRQVTAGLEYGVYFLKLSGENWSEVRKFAVD